jgi:hypothetical protein
LEAGAISTLTGLKESLAAPVMPDLTPVIVSVGAATVDAIKQTNLRLDALNDKFDRWSSALDASLRSVAAK